MDDATLRAFKDLPDEHQALVATYVRAAATEKRIATELEMAERTLTTTQDAYRKAKLEADAAREALADLVHG